jgi:hypothetical protein
MKKYLVLLILLLVIALSSCTLDSYNYSDFESVSLSSYYQAETESNNRHILYYYSSDSDACDDIKNDILTFFDGFDTLEYYMLDTIKIETESSYFGKFTGEPIIYIVSKNSVIEMYTGMEEITEFITEYSNIEYNYELFESQHLTTYEEVLNIDSESYVLYYYLDECTNCISVEELFLPWAFSKSIEDIYFLNGSNITNPDQIPSELLILSSGTPLILLMSSGVFTDEYYSGRDDVLDFINRIGTNDISTQNFGIEYTDFLEHFLDSFEDTLTISDNVHIEYYYSTYCAHCNFVKIDILNFFLDKEFEFYLINTSEVLGIPKIDSFVGVPSLYIIADNEPVEEYIGSTEILDFIDDYNDGLIDLTEYE